MASLNQPIFMLEKIIIIKIVLNGFFFWQQDENKNYCFGSISDRNISMILVCYIDIIILL